MIYQFLYKISSCFAQMINLSNKKHIFAMLYEKTIIQQALCARL